MNIDIGGRGDEQQERHTDRRLAGRPRARGPDQLPHLEKLNIWLGFGNNVFTINGTHSDDRPPCTRRRAPTLSTSRCQRAADRERRRGRRHFDVRATGLGSEVHLNGEEGDDTFNLSDLRACAARGYPATLPPPAATTSGKINHPRTGGDRRRTWVRRRQRRQLREHGQQGRHADVDHAARARDARRRELLATPKTSNCGWARAPTACTSTARTPERPKCSWATATRR